VWINRLRCLSSRMEYGRAVTPEALSVIERGEDALRAWASASFACAITGKSYASRLPRRTPRALSADMAREFTAVFKALGFSSSHSTWRVPLRVDEPTADAEELLRASSVACLRKKPASSTFWEGTSSTRP